MCVRSINYNCVCVCVCVLCLDIHTHTHTHTHTLSYAHTHPHTHMYVSMYRLPQQGRLKVAQRRSPALPSPFSPLPRLSLLPPPSPRVCTLFPSPRLCWIPAGHFLRSNSNPCDVTVEGRSGLSLSLSLSLSPSLSLSGSLSARVAHERCEHAKT